VVLHLSGQLVGGLWLVEARRPASPAPVPWALDRPTTVELGGGDGGRAELLAPFATSRRLWLARLDLPGGDALAHLARHGRAIRYGYVPRDWPLDAYQTVFASRPPHDPGLGSAEMPSAGRPFTAELVTALLAAGVVFAPITLHTGVSSLEAHEPPYAERYRVPATTARLVNEARADGRRIIAVGTTATRALETDAVAGRAHPGDGWTELVITPARGLEVVDGIISGWHEPEASHLLLMEAVAGRPLLEASYRAALAERYRWHEFGDIHLVL
jgi:S-adenosylmethionine:tRNA ribosyltransferase-isomerase